MFVAQINVPMFFMVIIISASVIVGDDRQKQANARAAIDELNEVLRSLFPIVPHKSQIFLSSKHRILIDPREQQWGAGHPSRIFHSKQTKMDFDKEVEAAGARSGHEWSPAGPSASIHQHQDTVLDSEETSGGAAPEMLPKAPPTPTNSEQQLQNKIYHMVLHAMQSNQGRQETGRNPSKPELTTPSLGKRGPECMRRCILQGLLHPVQCHSLC